MKQLMEQNMITYIILSFYIRPENDQYSHIKFGGYDVLKTVEPLKGVKPRAGLTSWSLEANNMQMNDIKIAMGPSERRYIELDP